MGRPSAIRPILLREARRRPRLEVRDLAKLVLQNEFGGGHLVIDEAGSRERLLAEIRDSASAGSVPGPRPSRFESIGNGYCRLHLAGIDGTGLSPETVHRMFLVSSEPTPDRAPGSRAGFDAKIRVLRRCLEEGVLPFPPAELDRVLSDLEAAGWPFLGHSAAYREAYAPAYRVVRSCFRDLLPVFRRIDAALAGGGTLRVAIDGPCGSGKSTLAAILRRVYGCSVLPMDHFFLPPALRTPGRLAEPGGNLDTDRLLAEVAPGLLEGHPVTYRPFDCRIMAPGRPVTLQPHRLLVLEGSYSLHPKLRDLHDLSIFLRISPDEQVRRIRARNGPDGLAAFVAKWIPMENRYFAFFDIAGHSDLVLRTDRTDMGWADPEKAR